MYTDSDIENLKSLIVQTIKPEKVILFGSYAYGTPTEKSDIDLLIIMPKYNMNDDQLLHLNRLLFQRCLSQSANNMVHSDLCIVSKKDYRELYNDRNSAIYDASRKGKVIYDTSKDI